MANPPCMYPDCEQSATFTGTFFESGQSITVCGDHFIDFAAGTLQAMTGAPIIDFLASAPTEVEDDDDDVENPTAEPGPTSEESSEVGTDDDHEEHDPNVELGSDGEPMLVVAADSEPDTSAQ